MDSGRFTDMPPGYTGIVTCPRQTRIIKYYAASLVLMRHMRTFSVVSRHHTQSKVIKQRAKEGGFTYDQDHPDFVISYGGDGTLFRAERIYPGIPKLMVKHSLTCTKCDIHEHDRMLAALKRGTYRLERLPKLKATLARKGQTLLALNDIVVRNSTPGQAIRFEVHAGKRQTGMVIGDGIVVSTPFGSTGYYHAITRSGFSRGLGIAFNNPTQPQGHWKLDANATIGLKLLRGHAVIAADNDPDILRLSAGGEVTIRQAAGATSLIKL